MYSSGLARLRLGEFIARAFSGSASAGELIMSASGDHEMTDA
jgi:hypothetical protein